MADNLGSVRDLVEYDSSTSATTSAYHIVYDAFGQVTSVHDSSGTPLSTLDYPHAFGFTGRERDEESDLQYNRARYFDAAIGQWISEDPIGFDAGDANLRRYVGNKSTFAVDPSGQAEWLDNLKWRVGMAVASVRDRMVASNKFYSDDAAAVREQVKLRRAKAVPSPNSYIDGQAWRDWFENGTDDFMAGYEEFLASSLQVGVHMIDGDMFAAQAGASKNLGGAIHDHSLMQSLSNAPDTAVDFVETSVGIDWSSGDDSIRNQLNRGWPFTVISNRLEEEGAWYPQMYERGQHSAFFWEVNADVALIFAPEVAALTHIEDARYVLRAMPRAPAATSARTVRIMGHRTGITASPSYAPMGAAAAEQAAIRARVLANIEASKASRLSSNFDVHLARTSQVGAPYGGVDAWTKTVIPKGTFVYGGYPGPSAFYTDLATVKASNLNAESLFKSLQVEPHSVRGYRPQVQAYRVLDDIEVPTGPVLANPQFGVGGGNQFYIQQFWKKLEPVRLFDLSR